MQKEYDRLTNEVYVNEGRLNEYKELASSDVDSVRVKYARMSDSTAIELGKMKSRKQELAQKLYK